MWIKRNITNLVLRIIIVPYWLKFCIVEFFLKKTVKEFEASLNLLQTDKEMGKNE